MKKKSVALYDPYLDILGGGEKHILSILRVLDEVGYDITVFWNDNLTDEIHKKLNIPFRSLRFKKNIFKTSSFIQKIKDLSLYDLFFYVTDGSYFFSTAKKNFVFCMVPDKRLYSRGLINTIKTSRFSFISNSLYTKSWLLKWSIQSDILYPYIPDEFFSTENTTKKEKVILSVGRFFSHLHSKKHSEIIDTFNELAKTVSGFRLILAGGLKKEDMAYFQTLVDLVKNNPYISLKPNISYQELLLLYRQATFYWHFAGYGIDEKRHPELVEHLGITPLEAMATGCITFCFNAGGPKEIIQNENTGFLFNSKADLITQTKSVLADESKKHKIQKQAKIFVKDNFSFPVFKKNVIKLLSPL